MSVRALSSATRYRPLIYVVAAAHTTRLICAEILARKLSIDCDIRSFDSLADGIAAFARMRPALVLTDSRFGQDTAQCLLALAGWGVTPDGVPSVVLAEASDQADLHTALGATDVVWKPLRPQRLVEVVGMALDAAKGRRLHAARGAFTPTLTRVGVR